MTTGLTFDELCDVLPDEWDALTVRISTDGSNLALELFRSGDDIFRKRISCQLSERRPFHQRRYLFDDDSPHKRRAPQNQRQRQHPRNA
jgi:hypothetical protein